MAKDVLFIPHNHLDPVWRRCFDRPAHYCGVTVRSYADLEELVINRFLALAESGYTYSDGQVAIWLKQSAGRGRQRPFTNGRCTGMRSRRSSSNRSAECSRNFYTQKQCKPTKEH